MAEILLEARRITKLFPGVTALDGVDFTLRRGEIHALMGENGAGKSTFIKVLTGVHQPDSGQILLNGQPVEIGHPQDAIRLGIAAIYQHLAAFPDLSVAENIFMGREALSPIRFIQWRKMNAEARKLLASLGSSIKPTERMGALSVAQQQLVEIAKALSQNAQILIMDEPTAALSRRESEDLYEIARELRRQGTSIILISHRMEDMYKLADRVSVLRDAQYIGTWDVADIDDGALIGHMVGRTINQYFPLRKPTIGGEVLRVEKLSRIGYFADVSFTLHKGEILCLTGLVGAGRTEIVESILGITSHDSGTVYVNGVERPFASPHDALTVGVGLLPEDRHKQGLLLPWTIGRNITLSSLPRFARHGLLSERAERAEGDRYKSLMRVRASSIDDTAASLSGGNQQKVVMAKLLSSQSNVLIIDEPTKGIDVASKAQIYEILNELTEKGYAVLMVSSELPEVVNMADNIVAIREGRVAEIIPHERATQQSVLAACMPLDKRDKEG